MGRGVEEEETGKRKRLAVCSCEEWHCGLLLLDRADVLENRIWTPSQKVLLLHASLGIQGSSVLRYMNMLFPKHKCYHAYLCYIIKVHIQEIKIKTNAKLRETDQVTSQ